MKLKEIHRTSTFAWSPTPSLPLLATGTVAGALDESFSNESQLEIWEPNFLDVQEFNLGGEGQHGPKGIVTDTARFNRVTWGCVDGQHPRGVIAAGMENGELTLWDPSKILAGAGNSESLILRNMNHTGPIRGLEFNPVQHNLLSSGGINGEVYIWDLKDPTKPYSPTPGSRSTKLDEITSVAWNQQVQYVLAGASSTGFTVVWDLRGKREVVALAYGGGAGTLAGQTGTGGSFAVGGRRGMSDIAWHPDNATRLVTASEDDSSPVIMVWDLRNARAPEKILTGHEKGVLSLSWCKQDADLLLSCGKDNRALCWNPQTSEIIGELPTANNWAFQVEWCPRNPDLLATAFFDGTIGIHSIQSTNDMSGGELATTTPASDGLDIFDSTGLSRTSSAGTLSLKQPPKWLRCPASSSFDFGGKLVSVSNLPGAHGKNQSCVVHIRKLVTEQDVVNRVAALQTAIEEDKLHAFAEKQSMSQAGDGAVGWTALLSLFGANSRDELVTLLGFSKAEVAARVAEAIDNLRGGGTAKDIASLSPTREDISEGKPSVVSFAEPEREETRDDESDHDDATPGSGSLEKTPSEISAGVTSDTTSATRLADAESTTTTVPSLFGDDNEPGTPQMDAGADFFSTLGISQSGNGSDQVLIPHHNYAVDSSVAATIGSGPSSVTSETMKSNIFKIYPSDESETDRLVTKALVLGDFESAVSLCLISDRFADAILLAVKGGPELLQRTQKAYFERRTASLPYLRLFQSVVTNDLSDIVQNADLQEWQEIFVILCTFAGQEEFPTLAEQLGRRLEFQFTVGRSSEDPDVASQAQEYRKNATLTYLAAGRLERLVNIWIDELAEEETELISNKSSFAGSRYTTHAQALQTFIEKVTVFRSAIKYVDPDLLESSNETAGTRIYKLAGLYERYLEYAEVLATQGLVKEAKAFLKLMPAEYRGPGDEVRDRLLMSTKVATSPEAAPRQAAVPTSTSATLRQTSATAPSYSGYTPYQPQTTASAQQTGVYSPYNLPAPNPATQVVSQPYTPTNQPVAAHQPSVAPGPMFNTYNPQASLTQPPHLRQQAQPAQIASMVPPPPRPFGGASPGPTATHPPPKRQENGGWNDAPIVNQTRGATPSTNKPAAITNPFPNAPSSPSYSPSMGPGQALPLPPRPGSVQAQPPPPLPANRWAAPPPFPPQVRPPSGPPGPGQVGQPPMRIMSPPQSQAPPRQPTPGQYGPPRGHAPVQTPPPGQFNRPPQGAAPPSMQPPGQYAPPGAGIAPPSQYTPPPIQQQPQHHPGPYAPPPGVQRPGPSQPPNTGPLPPAGPSGPPRAASNSTPQRVPKAPPAPKYPPGDRSHIPDNIRPAFDIISEHLERMRQTTPPQQKRLIDDLERRISPLFDALNCETLSAPVVEQLLVLTRAMANRDRPAALAIHVDMLTRGSPTDDIGLWMSGIKQLIMRM